MGLLKCDHESAFKQLPIYPPHADSVMVALKCPADGEIPLLQAQNARFWSSRCRVLWHNTVARAMARVFTRIPAMLPATNYYDDFSGAAPRGLETQTAAAYFEGFCTMVWGKVLADHNGSAIVHVVHVVSRFGG